MRFRFTIGKKIGTGFGILISLIVVVFGATFIAVNNGIATFKETDKTSNKLIHDILPSKEAVSILSTQITESRQLAVQWINDQSRNDVPPKEQFKKLIRVDVQKTLKELDSLSVFWTNENDRLLFETIKDESKKLLIEYDSITLFLPDISSYDDVEVIFKTRSITDQNHSASDHYNKVEENIKLLQESLEAEKASSLAVVRSSSDDAKVKFQSLRFYWFLAICLIVFAILIAMFTTNTIVKPLNTLRHVLLSLGRGVFPKEEIHIQNDEVGDMSAAVVELSKNLKKTSDFAKEVGQSNFNFPYEPLSDEDVLGHGLLKMRDELAETERILEQKVKERTEEVVQQRDENERQRLKLEDLYKAVTASIRYAKRLQNSILPPDEVILNICPKSFVFYKPKDIVSGDFYWFEQVDNVNYFAAVDCTGHGVPGAFMSLVGANGLNASLKEKNARTPGAILNSLNTFVSDSLNKNREENHIRDGMDIAICSINYETMELRYAGANNPLYIVRDGEFIIIKADKFAIGSFEPGKKVYTEHVFQLEKDDMIYLFSDGYADQFGGIKGKKFLYNRFRENLLAIHKENMADQKSHLRNTIKAWQGPFEQVDDILIIGVRV